LPVNRAQLHELLIIPENIPLAKGFAASAQIFPLLAEELRAIPPRALADGE
jgi:hypothetical protein